jgi:predicted DNA-binding antitoxin AbrB/MazE fold protein
MITTVPAVYEGGVLLPANPLPLADGTTVRLTVEPVVEQTPPTPEEVRARIMAIIAIPMEPGGDPTVTGRDHDRILYGGPKGAR